MNKKIFAVFAVCAALNCLFAGDFVTGTVDADWLNMRIKPGINEAVVGKIKEKREVQITRVVKNWLEINAPEDLKIFVAVSRINRNGVVTGELNMRTAMDTQSPILGVLTKGTKVEMTGSIKHGWVQIKKPESVDLKVYVSAFLVKYDSSKFDANGNIIGSAAPAKPGEVVPAKQEAVPVKNVEAAPEKTPAVPENKAAAPEKLEFTGLLTKYKFSTDKQTEYVLLTAPGGYTQAFVTGDAALLQANENKNVKISGSAAGRFGNTGAVIVNAESITAL